MTINIKANTSDMTLDAKIALRDKIQRILDELNTEIRHSKIAEHHHRKQ